MKQNKQDAINELLHALQEMDGDDDIPRNVREKMREIKESLTKQEDISLLVNKSLTALDALAEDNNLQGFVRTQIWHVSSLLEKLQ
jgi:uncharacterized protein (UPF0147 family)